MTEKITAVQKLIDTLVQYAVAYGFQVLGALIYRPRQIKEAGITIPFPQREVRGHFSACGGRHIPGRKLS